MKFSPLLLASLSNLAIGSALAAPTPEQVGRDMKYVVVFEITPDSGGNLVECKFDSAVDIKTNEGRPEFVPSAAFESQACKVLANGKWVVKRGDGGKINPVFQFCYWSSAIPDEPICSQTFVDKQ